MTKICSRCEQPKELSDFYTKKTTSDGLSYYCKKCQNLYCKEHFSKNKEYYHKKAKRSNHKRRTILRKLINDLKSKPCKDCNQTFPPECMDFDHLKDKKFLISSFAGKIVTDDLDELKTEIAKCEVVCSNCHRIRTKNRRTHKPE